MSHGLKLLVEMGPLVAFFVANWQYKSCVLKRKLVVKAKGPVEVMVGPPSGWQNLNGVGVRCRAGEGKYFESP